MVQPIEILRCPWFSLQVNEEESDWALLGRDGLPDLAHDEVGLNGAARVDGPALLLSGHAANVGGNVVKDGGLGHVDDVALAEGGGDGELILLEGSRANLAKSLEML